MTGKSYSIREMKTIVEYLTENKLYGEIRGRKMWMDFSNTQLTTRTWQSLKETFLKRILPDIHNPYYRLSIEQVNSFRAGYDISDKNKNKLEIHTVSDESNDPNENDTPQTNNDYGIKEEIIAGENIKCSKIPSRNRSSADTVIVDTCYETAEDIQKDLESPGGDKETKSLRDCITYSEPLTPMLQEVLDDFQSEPENEPETSDRENQVEIGHTVPDSDNINKETSEIIKEHDKLDNDANNISKKDTGSTVALDEKADSKVEVNESKDKKNQINQESADKKHPELKDDFPVQEAVKSVIAEKQTESENHTTTKNQLVESAILAANDSQNTDVVVVHDSNSEVLHPSDGLKYSNSTTDASLPNNPEALKKILVNQKNTKLDPPENHTDIKVARKRSNSEDTAKITNKKKTRLNKNKPKATSETESKTTFVTIGELKFVSIETNDKPMDIETISNKTDKPKLNKKDPVPSDKTGKPSTSNNNDTDKVLLLSDTPQSPNLNESAEIKNPCLQNVSLFDEQFNNTKYNTSESEAEPSKNKKEVIQDKRDENKANEVAEKQNEIVILKSHSESDTEELPRSPKKKHRPGVMSSKTERDRALANVFGFSSGAANSKRRRQLSRRRRTISQNNVSHNGGTDSSEWTSDHDSEVYVSPPRSRKNRPTKKYLKPQSGRILSLEEEGGLFVMYGKKIYPLVKDGKLVKNYLTYLPESDSEDERNYWKLKYEDEKKKAEELKRLLQKAKEPNSRRSTSSSAHPSALRNSTCDHNHPQRNSSETGKEICIPENNEKKPEPIPTTSESIKIKFTTKNDQEIHLEGNWPQIHNVLEHVVHIFHKEPQPISSSRSKTVVEPPSSVASGISTPVVITAVQEPGVDPEVHEKVNKIENEIFKEIEERDKEEKDEPNGLENNVTKRKAGKPRKSSQSSVSQSPAKRLKTSDISDTKEPEINATKDKLSEETVNDSSKKQLRTPRKNLNESLKNDTNTVQTRRSKLNSSKTSEIKDDEEVRYMFPPKTTRQTVKSTNTDKNSKDKPHKSTTKTTKIFSSPETVCSNSLESTQGYQDSDPSPMKKEFRKKKMINISEMKYKTISHLRRSNRKKSHPYLCYDGGECSNSSPGKIGDRDNSTLNSNIYRSESYQLLMPAAQKPFRQLDPIDETRSMGNEVQFIKHLDTTAKNKVFSVEMITVPQNTCQADSDFGSSSNISLPLSPELSVVESLSVSKDLLKTIEGGPTINEMQCNEALTIPTTCNQYLISDIDVSVPLMEQECGLESSNVLLTNNIEKPNNLVTESLLSKIGTINITDQTNVTDTLDVKLRDLLLESAKKIGKENYMDVDETNVEIQKKTRNKKRCSTPHKRKDFTKSKKVAKVPTLVEEEHTESFAKGGRQSCPPIIQALMPDEQEEINIAHLTITENVKSRHRKKKDIIKVKILKPKSKKSRNATTKSVQNSSEKSLCIDSGINDTESGVFLRGDESVDLIHNHSETCLQANDCVGDSLEFVENSIKTVLTLEDSVQSVDDILWQSQCESLDGHNIVPDFFCNDAQDVNSFYNPKPDNIDTCETVYHSPLGTESSLITEDLSDDLPQPQIKNDKWYLLSEDEATNTNMNTTNLFDTANVTSFGANLKQIFPLTCAVPDLSTITEMSRESDNSRRPIQEVTSGDGFDSQNVFD